MSPLGLLDLLELKNFDAHQPSKLVRHRDARYDVHDLARRGWLEAYQAYQARPVFDKCEFVISFIGIEDNKARFIGVYRVLGRRTGKSVPLPSGCPFTEWTKNPYYYDLKHEPGYEDLENRMVIEWGRGALAWHQRLSNKEIVEILPEGTLLPVFRDYLEVSLTYRELKYLYEHEDVNREWRARLSAVAGVYLVLASTTGAQYVGSASGTRGIWGRWEEYARNGHAGNKLLQKLVKKDKSYPEAFTFSLLHIVPKTLARPEVLKWEKRYKDKLGSRAVGLNAKELV